MNRRSSIYSLRVASTRPERLLPDLVHAAQATGNPNLDSHHRIEDGEGYAAVGFRAADDATAARTAINILDWAELYDAHARLFTGFGQARREVSF